jgi:type IV pilus assembly protein PilE
MKSNIKLFRKKLKAQATSLNEIIIVIAIVGVLSTAGYMGYTKFIAKAKSTEAQTLLRMLHTAEKSYFFENNKYSSDFNEIGFEANKTTKEGGKGNYTIEIINASEDKFIAKATAIKDFDSDGAINVWEIDQDGNLIEKVKD